MTLIVVSDGFHDEVAEVCAGKPDVLHVKNEGVRQYAARRTGLKYVKTPKVLLFDDDDVIYPETIKRVLPKTIGYDMVLGFPTYFMNDDRFMVMHYHNMEWSEYLNISGIIFDTEKITAIHNTYDLDEEAHNEDFFVALRMYQDGCSIRMLPEFNYIKWDTGLKPWTKTFRQHAIDYWRVALDEPNRHDNDPLIEFYFSRRKRRAGLWLPTIKCK